MGISEALLYSVLGIAVVFFALILLMIIIKLMVKIIPAEKPAAETAAAAPAPAPEVPKEKAPGTAGEIALNGVEPRIAAMCMAIVADELKKPLNELRFISIKEIKE